MVTSEGVKNLIHSQDVNAAVYWVNSASSSLKFRKQLRTSGRSMVLFNFM